jgi:8-oxo-dGTP pyrophosphatase MutT (NUDIX family)
VWTLRREAARVVLLDLEGRVLLLEARDPLDASKGVWWELPGGGIERGEDSAAAAARELREETGIEEVEIGRCLWRHHARFTFGGYRFDQREHIHVGRLRAGVEAPGAGRGGVGDAYRPGGLEALEVLAFRGFRWWSQPELDGLVRAGGKVIPPWLPAQMAVARGTHPAAPIDMGELGDAV